MFVSSAFVKILRSSVKEVFQATSFEILFTVNLVALIWIMHFISLILLLSSLSLPSFIFFSPLVDLSALYYCNFFRKSNCLSKQLNFTNDCHYVDIVSLSHHFVPPLIANINEQSDCTWIDFRITLWKKLIIFKKWSRITNMCLLF